MGKKQVKSKSLLSFLVLIDKSDNNKCKPLEGHSLLSDLNSANFLGGNDFIETVFGRITRVGLRLAGSKLV